MFAGPCNERPASVSFNLAGSSTELLQGLCEGDDSTQGIDLMAQDVFGVGCLVYMMLTGNTLFTSEEGDLLGQAQDILRSHQELVCLGSADHTTASHAVCKTSMHCLWHKPAVIICSSVYAAML